MIESKDVVTALDFATRVPDLMRSARSGSLVEYTRPTRVEPMVLVDLSASQLPYIEDILNAGLNIFAGYYLQAVSLSVNVGDVNVMQMLEKLQPNRDPIEAASHNRWSLLLEDSNMSLPFFGESQLPEGYSQEYTAAEKADDYHTGRGEDHKVERGDGSDLRESIKNINENASLSVGKLIEVNITSQGEKASFPVQVRLRVNTVRPDVLAHTLSLGSRDISAKERFHGWRSGQLRFFKDLVLAQDIIEQHQNSLLKDSSGYYRSRMDNRRKNKLSALLSGSPSVATASSIMVMTSETAKDLELRTRKKLEKFKDREKIFSETYAMMFFVIDPDWEQVTIYHRSIEQPTEVSVRDMQRTNKRSDGPDITEILNAFRQNQSPTI